MVEAETDRRLVLECPTRPYVIAKVDLELTAENGGTRIRMTEYPTGGIPRRVHNPVLDFLTYLRNARAGSTAWRALQKRSDSGAPAGLRGQGAR